MLVCCNKESAHTRRCHDKGCTVQGAISAASAVANAALQAKDFPLPQTLLLQCPANVREQVLLPVPRTQCVSVEPSVRQL